MTLANKLTVFRILLIPVFVITLINHSHKNYNIPLIIFSFAIITDALDGFVARRRNEKTILGSFLDPIADKILMVSSYILLTVIKKINPWIAIIIFTRELIIILGWSINYIITNNKHIAHRFLGKATTLFQMLTVFLILYGITGLWKNILLNTTVFITIASGFEYVSIGFKTLNHEEGNKI